MADGLDGSPVMERIFEVEVIDDDAHVDPDPTSTQTPTAQTEGPAASDAATVAATDTMNAEAFLDPDATAGHHGAPPLLRVGKAV